MPKCLSCGNTVSFGSTAVSPAAPTANGPFSGLVANFDEKGYITDMESMGADLEAIQEAWEDPAEYFNICYLCGSEEIDWNPSCCS